MYTIEHQNMRQKLIELQGEINKDTIIVVVFSTPLSLIDRSNRQKINKNITELKSAINQLSLIDIISCFIR